MKLGINLKDISSTFLEWTSESPTLKPYIDLLILCVFLMWISVDQL